MTKLLAFDYGASGGRAILGNYNGEALQLNEVHRFSNDAVTVNGTIYWDVLRLFHEMKQGMLKCLKNGDNDISSIGVDTWGVDFGLLGSSGELLGNPVHYRDSRNEGMIEEACSIIPRKEIYQQTGIQFMKFNTLYQLLSMKLGNSQILDKASTMLLMPDLLNYFLTGEKLSEYTIVSTTQMYNPNEKGWARSLLSKLGLPQHILTDIVNPGTVVGKVRDDICKELNIGSVPVIAVAEHDTGSAVASVPAVGEKYAYISCGTWSLLGIESPVPIINETTYSLDYTNEGGINNTIRMLKNIIGLWIYQECKKAWDKTGNILTYDELEQMAFESEPFMSLIDPDNSVFYSPGNMPEKVREFCRSTGQKVPDSKISIVRCILESLALKYRMAIEGLDGIVGYRLPVIHMVGGGCRNTMLCQFTANSTGRPVIAGPAEATAVGNILCQLVSLGEISGIKEGRELVRTSFPTTEYAPANGEQWEDAYGRFLNIIERGSC